ncbi:hypothetical protein SO078_18455 (plasmid) [Sinorhizobium meliloti]|jgi:hypothetical protein|nr:hypothetical protein [Sinorhizobium meliloti]WRQ70455.1 hypothetical protein SO078_18455 [Sinorhizobium meliloti]GCA53440.1 hypothetical protein KGO5_05911 [Sinorhizobium sp. KGO-5]
MQFLARVRAVSEDERQAFGWLSVLRGMSEGAWRDGGWFHQT